MINTRSTLSSFSTTKKPNIGLRHSNLQAWLRRIAARKKLNSPLSVIQVERIHFDRSEKTAATGMPASVILKSLPQPLRSEAGPPSFLEELANYQFLDTVRDAFPYFPQLYFGNETAIILEDLGLDKYIYDSAWECAERLAETMARLHCATAGKEAEYLTARSRHALPLDDLRVWSADEQNAFFDIGLRFVKQLDAMRPAVPVFLTAKEIVNHAKDFRTFIHDDISARRQTVSTADALYLIDFETGKYAHRLLDVVKPILGKVERRRKLNRYFLNTPGFSPTLFEAYYDKCAALDGGAIDRKTWEKHFYACCLFITFANLGLAIRADQLLPAATSRRNILAQILNQLALVLAAANPRNQIIKIHAPIQKTIEQLRSNAPPGPTNGRRRGADD